MLAASQDALLELEHEIEQRERLQTEAEYQDEVRKQVHSIARLVQTFRPTAQDVARHRAMKLAAESPVGAAETKASPSARPPPPPARPPPSARPRLRRGGAWTPSPPPPWTHPLAAKTPTFAHGALWFKMA